MRAALPSKPTWPVVAGFAIATAGWVAFALQLGQSSHFMNERDAQRVEAAHWKRVAGKAYTAYLKEVGGGHPDVIQIPRGATIGCASKGSRIGCDSTLVYPPEDY